MSSRHFEPLSYQQHEGFAWLKSPDWGFARDMGLVPMAAMELPQAVGHLPLAFTADDDGGYQLVAILGVDPRDSLAVAPDGRFLAGYYPACLRTHPFRVLKQRDSETRVVAVNRGLLVSADSGDGQPLFDASGEPAELVQRAIAFLKELAASQVATEQAVKALVDHGLLELWNPVVALPKKNIQLDGLYRISQKALSELEGDGLKAVQHSGALDVAYAQLYSMAQLRQLSEWAGHLVVEESGSLDDFFGEGSDDLVFDFDS